MAEMYDDEKHVKDTFTAENLSQYLIQAQLAEFVELQKAISEVAERMRNDLLQVLDIGIGNARVLENLIGIKELWEKIGQYHGIDVSQQCVDLSREVIKSLGITEKTSVQLLDAIQLGDLDKKYDLIISTWFTAGNFYPTDFDFENFEGGYDMSTNDKFTKIFQQAYEMLNPGGEIIIGSMYIDNEATRKKQEESYRNFGWEIITDERDCFTASKDGWWSQRFTKERVHNYLPFVDEKDITFIDLDTYEYAMMVRIKKPNVSQSE